MSNDMASSDVNHCGSVPTVDYHNYPYASHHVQPLGGHNTGTHSAIDDFSNDPCPQDEIILGYGTHVAEVSEKKHKADMEEQLKAIDIDQKFQLKQENEQAKQVEAKST